MSKFPNAPCSQSRHTKLPDITSFCLSQERSHSGTSGSAYCPTAMYKMLNFEGRKPQLRANMFTITRATCDSRIHRCTRQRPIWIASARDRERPRRSLKSQRDSHTTNARDLRTTDANVKPQRRGPLVRRNKRRSFAFTATPAKSFRWNSVFPKRGTECPSFSKKGRRAVGSTGNAFPR